MAVNRWTRHELIVAFNLYPNFTFGQLHTGTRAIQELAGWLGRSPGSIAMRLSNFAHVDPYHQQRGIVGLANGVNQVKPIWDEFVANQEVLVFESEHILAAYQQKSLDELHPDLVADIQHLRGEDRERLVRTRVNQRVFRQMILKTYGNRCAVSGLNVPALLVAGHIVPWSVSERDRLNPENGICFSPLYDRAYESGLICVDMDYRILLASRLRDDIPNTIYQSFFGQFDRQLIHVPKTYLPNRQFLEYRLDRFNG